MASQAALKYAENLSYGAAVPAGGVQYGEERVKRSNIPIAQPSAEQMARERARRAALEKQKYSISLFGIVGSVAVTVLMLFLVLAYINYTEISNETVRLQSRLDELMVQERRLEIEYEKVFDLNEVERYATSVLGMTKPDSDQVIIAQTAPEDKAEIIAPEETSGTLGKLGSFISTLLEYF